MPDPACSIALSIVVPVLNEADRLPDLFGELGRQRGISFELILSDGGSSDHTVATALRLADGAPFPCHIVCGPPGRGRQMNTGARESSGRTLLFLHADSAFPESTALEEGLSALDREISLSRNDGIAGHFALRFLRRDPAPSLAYYYYEVKACLDRPGCIHGDQGFMLRKTFFEQVGPFDESLGFLEDNRLAELISRAGRWILLPGLLATSARRFEGEGLYARQMLNLLIVALDAAGRSDFLQALPELYRQQQRSGPLRQELFYAKVRQLLRSLPSGERRHFWNSAGRLAVENLWQLFLFLDARKGFRRGIPQEQLSPRLLFWYERSLKGLVENPVGYFAGLLPAWLWFRWMSGAGFGTRRNECGIIE
jgi:rSAM/selenodomain-associated transferase 2